MERIKLDKKEVIDAIYECKSQKEMAKRLGCGTDKLRKFLNVNGLYELFCSVHNVPYKPQKLLPCIICGETKNTSSLRGCFYCKRHYNQMYRYGKIVESTIYDKNEIIIDGDIAKIIIKDKNQNYKCESIIDAEDVEKIKDYKWYESYGYCVTKGVDHNNGIDIANVIFNDLENRFDHQNHDRLDNRKSNLRSVSAHQNAMNMGKKRNNNSGVTGVQKQNKHSSRWTAAITYNYKPIWLGLDKNFDKVVLYRLLGEVKYFKEYSPNYNVERNAVCLKYRSQSDNMLHYIEVDMDGNVLQNITYPEVLEDENN